MIGGDDIIIEAKDSLKLRLLVLRYIRSQWPKGCMEVDGQDHFYYQDHASQVAWETEGGTDTNQDSMIYAIYEPDALTLVVSHFDGSKTQQMAHELKQLIEKR